MCEQGRLLQDCTFVHACLRFSYSHMQYEGCSNMNVSSFITLFTYMLRQNVILFRNELFVAFKMTPSTKKHSLYFSSYRRLYKGHSCILKFFEANCHTHFGTYEDIVSYLCKFETKLHQILDASLRYIDKLLAEKSLYNPVLISSKQACL